MNEQQLSFQKKMKKLWKQMKWMKSDLVDFLVSRNIFHWNKFDFCQNIMEHLQNMMCGMKHLQRVLHLGSKVAFME